MNLIRCLFVNWTFWNFDNICYLSSFYFLSHGICFISSLSKRIIFLVKKQIWIINHIKKLIVVCHFLSLIGKNLILTSLWHLLWLRIFMTDILIEIRISLWSISSRIHSDIHLFIIFNIWFSIGANIVLKKIVHISYIFFIVTLVLIVFFLTCIFIIHVIQYLWYIIVHFTENLNPNFSLNYY